MSKAVIVWLPGKAPGKARPRLGKNKRVHMPSNYIKWKNKTAARLSNLGIVKLPEPCFIQCDFVNFFSSDSDNLVGSVLDAFVDAGALTRDSKSVVVGCSGRFWKKRKKRNQPKEIGILVTVIPQQIVFFNQDIPA